MQLPKIIKRKEKEEGIREGRREAHEAWTDWNRRRIAAGDNFNEPPPKPEYD